MSEVTPGTTPDRQSLAGLGEQPVGQAMLLKQRAVLSEELFQVGKIPAQSLMPHRRLWEVLVEAADEVGQQAFPVPNEVAAELWQWFGPTALSKEVQRLLETGVRVAQEALTSERSC